VYAILHEGKANKSEDNNILKLLLKELDLDESKVKFFGFGSKINFLKKDNPRYKELLTEISEDTISKILLVADADYESNDHKYGGFENTKIELNKIVDELGIENISDLYVTRDPKTDDGYMESLIFASIPQKQKECIENFLNCSEFKSKENHKAILNQIYNMAYPNAPFDFNHSSFDELKQKLTNLFN